MLPQLSNVSSRMALGGEQVLQLLSEYVPAERLSSWTLLGDRNRGFASSPF